MTPIEIGFLTMVVAAFAIFMVTLYVVAKWTERTPKQAHRDVPAHHNRQAITSH